MISYEISWIFITQLYKYSDDFQYSKYYLIREATKILSFTNFHSFFTFLPDISSLLPLSNHLLTRYTNKLRNEIYKLNRTNEPQDKNTTIDEC